MNIAQHTVTGIDQEFAPATCSPWTGCSGIEYNLSDKEILDLNFSNPDCTGFPIQYGDLNSATPRSPTLYTPDSMNSSCHDDFSLPSPASTISCAGLSEVDWNAIMGIETAPEKSRDVPCLDHSTELKDWAWMDAMFPSPPESDLDKFHYDPSDNELEFGSNPEDSPIAMFGERKPGPESCKKRSHNAIERKYRESVNSKLVKIDGWLSDHRASRKKSSGESLKRTKGAILTDALCHLQYLSRCKTILEKERKVHKVQIATLKRLAAR